MTKKKVSRTDEIIDELLREYGVSAEAILGRQGLVKDLTKRVVERALAGELTHHLGYEKGQAPEEVENHRNGYSTKRMKGEKGEMEIAIPRDRDGSFEPVLVRKGQRRFEEFDDRIIAMYGRGMTVREIQGFLEDQYGVEVSADFISTVTDSVLGAMQEWQNRPLEGVYAVVLFDALRVRIRDEGTVKNKAVYLALGTRVDGTKEVLGIWIEQNEGAKFWLKVMNELRNRGMEDMLIAVVDGLKGFGDAIRTVYPQTAVQTCIVHLVRYSLSFCGWKERKTVAAELKKIYRAENAQMAWERLEEFAASALGKKYGMIVESWKRNWEEVIPFLSYPEAIRKTIYTTNAIESLNMELRKVSKNRGHFPHNEAAMKLLWLALEKITRRWSKAASSWPATALQLAINYGDRFTQPRR
jgi:transposase-like protein